MSKFKIKTLALSVTLVLGSAQVGAFSFVNDSVEPKMGSVPAGDFMNKTVGPQMGSVKAEDFMNKTVEPVSAPVSNANDTQKEMAKIAAENKQKALNERASLEREMVEKQRAEVQERQDLEQEMLKKQRAKDKADSQKRQKLEREMLESQRAKAKASKNAAKKQAQEDATYLGEMRNEAINFVNTLNLVEMKDRLRFKAHYDDMVGLANGDKANDHVKTVGLIGARQYHSNALGYVQEHGQYLFADASEAKEWGFRSPPSMTKGELVEIMKTWPDRLKTGQSMLNLAIKYANLGGKQATEFAQFQKYLDWRQSELQGLIDHSADMQADPEYNADDRIAGGITLGGLATGAVDGIKSGFKNIADRCFWNCN